MTRAQTTAFAPGDHVKFTAGPERLGVMAKDPPFRFDPDIVVETGEHGVVQGPHKSLPGWLLVDIERDGKTYVCPVPSEMIEGRVTLP